MFFIAYAIIVLIGAIPFALTLWRGAPPGRVAGRVYRDIACLGAAILVVIALDLGLRISLENYWFAELGQQYRYWFELGLRAAIFGVVFLIGGLFVALNLRLSFRPIPFAPPSAPWIAGFIASAAVASSAVGRWTGLAAFLGARSTGQLDPVFHQDLTFYLLRLPVYEAVNSLAMTLVFLTLAAWAALGVSFFGVIGALRLVNRGGRPRFVVVTNHDDDGADAAPRVELPASLRRLESHDADRAAWLTQGLVLGALLCLLVALAIFLGRYHLVIDGHSTVVPGASWIDTHVWIPANWVFIAAWALAAASLAAAAIAPGFRTWIYPRRLRWAVGGFAGVYIAATLVPILVENLYVGPNQITLEQPYVVRGIEGTRRAYNLEGPSVDEQEFAISSKSIGRDDLAANAPTLRDARIWDWRALKPQLQQTQGLRPYYDFSDVDVDRYQVNGAEREVMITPRELDVTKLPSQAQVWVNLALRYTHGFGAVAAPAAEIDENGNPILWSHDIPVQAQGELAVKHGEIYYGLQTHDRVYVHTSEKEFDYPHGDANVETTYGGAGGIPLSSLWRKLTVAHAFDGLRLFISGYFTPQSRVLMRRNIYDRVHQLAPFLTLDHDPYIVADGDHYAYVIDGYTGSRNYPYSEAYHGSVELFAGANYARNSVKAVVDAYNGSVTFYVFTPDDPIIAAYRRMLPGLFHDASEMPAALRRHIRYPEDLFTAQAEMYGTYHMTNPTTFYNREDRWEVPKEIYKDSEEEVQPYYVMAQLPHSAAPEFVLILPLSVAGKNQMAGWLAGRSDGANYGKLVAYRFPKGQFIDGPAQVESRINSDSRFSGDLTLWNQQGSSVIRGNLIILPLAGNQLVAIEPVYIEAEQTKIPTLARVVFGQLLPDNRKIEWAPTLAGAEDLLVGDQTPTPAQPGQPGAPGSPTQQPALAQTSPDRLKQAQDVYRDMQKAYASGDYVRYGQLMQQLGKILAP